MLGLSVRPHSPIEPTNAPEAITPVATNGSPVGKNIVVFCDGTGQDGLIASLSKEEAAVAEVTPKKSVHATTYPTNVLRLSRCVPLWTDTEPRQLQLVLYQSGVGVGDDFQGSADLGDNYDQARGTATGGKIRDAYNFVAQNYEEGDRIYLFGFSRGAYTARKVAGLICKLGLLDRWEMGKFFHYWSALDRNDPNFNYKAARTPSIQFVGTWDTVGSVFEDLSPKVNALNLVDTELPHGVVTARHALAYHENRKEFLPTPYVGFDKDRDVQQVWFPGSHSDVGGSYNEHLIADITLCWMAGEAASAGITLDEEFLRGCFTQDPAAELRLHFERRPGVPFLTVNRMNVVVKTALTKEVTLSNVESQFLYHHSLWADVSEHRGGHSHRAFPSKGKDPEKKPFTPFEEKYWKRHCHWDRLLTRSPPKPTPRGGAPMMLSPPQSPMHTPPISIISYQPVVEFENFSDYAQDIVSGAAE